MKFYNDEDEEEKRKKLEEEAKAFINMHSIGDSINSINFANINNQNIITNSDEERIFADRVNDANNIINSLNPRHDVKAPHLSEEERNRLESNANQFIDLIDNNRNVTNYQEANTERTHEENGKINKSESTIEEKIRNRNIKQQEDNWEQDKNIINIMNKIQENKKQKNNTDENIGGKENYLKNRNQNVPTQITKQEGTSAITDTLKNSKIVDSKVFSNAKVIEQSDLEAIKKAERLNKQISKGGTDAFEAYTEIIGDNILEGFGKKPIAGLVNVGTTLSALGLRGFESVAKIIGLNEAGDALNTAYNGVVDFGSKVNEKANLSSNVTSQIKDEFTRGSGQVTNVISNMLGNTAIGYATGIPATAIQGLSVGGSSAQEVLDENKNNIGQATITGLAKGYTSYLTEKMFDANILTRGETSSISRLVDNAISNKIKSRFGKEFANRTIGIIGENLEELVEDNVDNLIDKLINGKETPDFLSKEWWSNTSETAKVTTLSTMIMGFLGLGGDTFENKEKDIQAESWINKAQEIIEQEDLAIHYDPRQVKTQNSMEEFYITQFNQEGQIESVTPTIGKEIENIQQQLMITPVIVKDNNTNMYEVIDGMTGVVLDNSYYDTIVEAEQSYNEKIKNLSDNRINDINNTINDANYVIKNNLMDIVTRLEEQLPEISMLFIENNNSNTTNTTEDKNTDILDSKATNYTTENVKPITDQFKTQTVQSETIVPQNGKFTSESINNAIESVTGLYEQNNENKRTSKRTFEKEIEEYKGKRKTDNKINGNVLEIDNNIFDGISKKKQSSFMNEYLKNEIQGKDYYVDGNKINATSVTVGKLKNGKTNFDKNIPQNVRNEIKANIIGNLENFLSTSQLYQPDRIDTKNHTFADTFDRRKSIVKYKGQNYEVMFEIGKKSGINTLYGIESVKKTNKNRLSLPNLASNNRGLSDTNKSVGSHKSKDSIAQKEKSVKSTSNFQNTNIQDFGEKIGGARKDLATTRTNTKSGKEVIHDYTVQNGENGYTVNFKGKVLKDGFKTQAEAEKYILDFKENIKSNRAFVEEVTSRDGEPRYSIYLRNPRTLRSQHTGKVFSNKQDAENYAMALSMYLKENGKNLFRPQIQKVKRTNTSNKNATKATGDDILNKFGFKGGEFGNWVTQNERQQFLNYAQDAFTDLAVTLDVTPDSLGQQKAMSIAFGARGQGLTGAVAHFEPGKKVINLTRLKGAGSLAHEYGHSIDNYLSRVGGYNEDGMATENYRNPKLSDNMKNAIKEVTDAIKYNISTNQEEIDKKNAIYEKARKENLEYNLRYIDKVFKGEAKNWRRIKGKYEEIPIKVTEKQKSDYQKIRETLVEGKLNGDIDYKLNGQTLKTDKTYPEPINKLQQMYKEVVGRKLDDETVYSLYRQGKPAMQVTEVKSESAYSKSALELDKATGRTTAYFSRIDEMWARAFESYISDKLKAKGITDTYLVHSVNNNEYALFNPFPAGEERKNINKAFDNLIQVMKDEGLFTSSGTPQNIDNDTGIRYMKRNTTSYNNYTKKELENLKNSKTIRIAKNEKDVQTFVSNAKKMKSNFKLYFGKIKNSVADNIKNLLNIDVTNYNISLKNDDIRKILKDHGTEKTEIPRGQVPITESDFLKIPDIINNPDIIESAGTTEKGKPAIRFEKNIDGNNVVITYVSDKHHNLEMQTMYKFKNNKNRDSSTGIYENNSPSLNTSQTSSGTISLKDSIPQNGSNVKNDTDIRFAKRTSKETDNTKRNAERGESYIEQEIQKIEKTGNWDDSIPVTKLTDIRKTIENYLGLGVKKGHFRQDAYGIYKNNRDVIRTREYKDIDTILHESGHAMDLGNRLKVDKESIADELFTAIDRLGGYEQESRTVRLEEGFAEVIREYSIIPKQAKIDYPQSVAILEGLRKTDTKFNNFITKVQQQAYNYIHQNPRNRTLSNMSIGEQTDKKNTTYNLVKQEVMRNIYDKDWAVKSAVNELAKANGKTVNQIKASNNAYYLTRLASGISDKIVSMLSDGYIDENGNKLFPGLRQIGEILGDNPERYNDFRASLVANRDVDYKAKTLKTGLRDMDTKTVREQFKNDTQIQQSNKLVYDTLDGVMQYAVNNGLISQENVEKLKESNAFYVPMQRVIENRGNQVGQKGAVADIIRQRTGSELDVKDVLENIIANSSNVIRQVENNNILKAFYKEGQSTGLTGTIFDVIDAPMTKIGTQTLEIWEKELQKQGVDTKDLNLEKTIDLFAPNKKVDAQNLITSFIDDDGKRIYLQFNDEVLFNSLMNLDSKTMSIVLKINSKMNMPLRYGATMANLGFAIPNMISDTAQAAIFSTAGFIPVVDNALGVLDILASTNKTVRNFVNSVAPEYAERINKLYSLYQQSGATNSTRLSQYRESSQNLMADVYGTKNKNLSIKEKFKPLKRLLDLMTYIPEISEQSTRFEVFKKNYDYYKKKGTSEMDSRILAALESRDATQDFGRTGNVTREINQLIPFSAAKVGSAYTFAEKVKANPKQVGMRIAILTAIAMGIKAMGYDDDKIDELNQRKKDDNFVMRVGDDIVTIKKPQGILRGIVNLAEYIQDLATDHIEEGKEGERLGEWLNNAIMDNMPADEVTGLVPNAVAPLIENAINKDFYYNTDIVKSYDLDLPDSEQYYDYNSQLAIWLGKIFNYSPAKIDNLISGYFGGLGTSITDTMDYALGKMGVIPEQPEMGAEDNTIAKRFIVNVNTNSSSIDEIYNRKTELTKLQNGGIISSEEEKELEKIKSAISNISDLNKQIKEIEKDLSMSGKEKAEQIKILQQEKTDTARQALGKELIHSNNGEKIQSTQFYPNDTLKDKGYSLTLSSEQKKEYEQLAYDYYNKHEKQGVYNEEKLANIKTKAKEYAKNQLFKKYKANLVKTK